jgi:hypothetical protein
MAGTFNFTAMVTDGASVSATQPFIITVTQRPLTFLTTSLQPATEGKAYSDAITVSGGTAPYVYAVDGTLPTGLALRSTGIISGTPARGTAGSYSFNIRASDSSSPTTLTGQQSFTLTIEEGGFEVTVSIGSGLKAGETRVIVGNSPAAVLQGGGTARFPFDLGVITTITVDPVVQHPSEAGIRYKAEVDKITVNEFTTTANFPYYAEYNIEFKTEPSDAVQLTGSGWYKEGYALRATAPSEVADKNDAGTQYRFSKWKLPTGETIANSDLSLTVSAPGSCTAIYDKYYKLTVASPYGETEGSNWYKAGSAAEWRVKSPEIRMPGILGAFGGKLTVVNAVGTSVMDSAKTVNINWEADYTLPFILIPLALGFIILLIYGIYKLSNRPHRPAPFPPYFQPPFQPMPPQMPPPPATVVMIGGEKQRLGPPSTREQLMEKFGELLEKYEDEIKTKISPEGMPGMKAIAEAKAPPAPELPPPSFVESEIASEKENAQCDYASKRPLRVVSVNWRKMASKDAPQQSEEETGEGASGPVVVWARDIYQEWEILTCWLQRGHEGKHDGSVQIVYSLINTVTEVKMYKLEQELTPPKPHYTDSMPQVDVSAREMVSADKLPSETISAY